MIDSQEAMLPSVLSGSALISQLRECANSLPSQANELAVELFKFADDIESPATRERALQQFNEYAKHYKGLRDRVVPGLAQADWTRKVEALSGLAKASLKGFEQRTAVNSSNLSGMQLHLQKIAIGGVWIPLTFTIFWLGGAMLIGAIGGSNVNAGLAPLLAMSFLVVPFIAAHAVFVSGCVGVFLLIARKTKRIFATMISAFVGLTLGSLVFSRVYLNLA